MRQTTTYDRPNIVYNHLRPADNETAAEAVVSPSNTTCLIGTGFEPATPEPHNARSAQVQAWKVLRNRNATMFFIILATALTLHRAGMTKLDTSRQVAEALAPLARRFASLLYTVGLLGMGALAIPALAGAGAYVFAEIFHWRQGMDEPYTRAPASMPRSFVRLASARASTSRT
jgi:Mn2+/Fe2+ NRAMP family transporter